MDKQEMNQVVEAAQMAFWAEVAKNFDFTTGDFPPEAQLAFDEACKQAVKVWVQSNS